MAITKTSFQLRPPTVTAVLYDKASDASEIAAWVKGRVEGDKILIPDYDGTTRYVVTLGNYVVQMDSDSFIPLPQADFERDYTDKVV